MRSTQNMLPMTEDAEQKEEEVPLLQDESRDSTPVSRRIWDGKDLESGAFESGKEFGAGWHQHMIFKVNGSGKVCEYDSESLLSPRAMWALTGTIFVHPMVWFVIPYVALVALSLASLVFFLIPDARRFNTSNFSDFVKYIKAFIAIILGLYVKKCYGRWWESVSTFKTILISIKQLVYTLRAIEVREELVDEIQRLCVASCYVLHAEVHTMQFKTVEGREARWKKSMQALVTRGFLKPQEQAELLRDYRRHSEQLMGVHTTMVWTWIGEVMGALRSESNVAPPMYVRMLFLAENCLAKVDNLKTFMLVQIPFPYAHMLASLVHLANIMMAISVGLTLGSALDEIVSRDEALALHTHTHKPNMVREFYEALQVCMMQAVVLLLQPTLYQAFLVIAHGLSYPYGDELWHMPVETYIDHMVLDLRVMKDSRDDRRTEFLCGHMDREKKEKDESEEDDDDE